jgi:hypothetical protein
VRLTTLATIGWLILSFSWLAFAWSHYRFLQMLAGLGIVTLLYVAVTGVLWVVDQALTLAATILAIFGWLSFTLYWLAFAWSRYTLLQNGAILLLSFLVCGGAVVVLTLRAALSE